MIVALGIGFEPMTPGSEARGNHTPKAMGFLGENL